MTRITAQEALAEWRKYVSPRLSNDQLYSLAIALATNSPQLIQTGTTSPPPLQVLDDYEVKGCCPIAFTFWDGGKGECRTVREVFTKFNDFVGWSFEIARFMAWWDDGDRDTVFRELEAEVSDELKRRGYIR